MKRLYSLSLWMPLVGAFLAVCATSTRAAVPTECTDLTKMLNLMYMRTIGQNRPTYLPVNGGTPVSNPRDLADPSADPLMIHVDDLFCSGFNNRVDPRLLVAIAGRETNFGTACDLPRKEICACDLPTLDTSCAPGQHGIGETEEINDNPFGVGGAEFKGTNYGHLGGRGGAIDAIGAFLGNRINSSSKKCRTIPDLIKTACGRFASGGDKPAEDAAWIHDVRFFYGTNKGFDGADMLGGNPYTTDLTFMKEDGLGGDCAHGDCSMCQQGNWAYRTDVSDILTLVDIALGDLPVSACPAGADDSTCGGGGAAASGQAGPQDEGGGAWGAGCGTVSIANILNAVHIALDGPEDIVAQPPVTPILDPCAACFNPDKNQYDCGYCQPFCGDDACNFCQSDCPTSPCADCFTSDTDDPCTNCPCGDADCPFCEDSCVATPTPPPTPTPTPTAACTIMLYRGSSRTHPTPPVGYDCDTVSAFVQVLPPFKPTVAVITQNPLEESIYMGKPTPQPDSSTKFLRNVFLVGLGPFYPTITVSDDSSELCHRDFGYEGDPPFAKGVVGENGDPDARLCGLGGGETPGVVWPRPPTATMTPPSNPPPTPNPCDFCGCSSDCASGPCCQQTTCLDSDRNPCAECSFCPTPTPIPTPNPCDLCGCDSDCASGPCCQETTCLDSDRKPCAECSSCPTPTPTPAGHCGFDLHPDGAASNPQLNPISLRYCDTFTAAAGALEAYAEQAGSAEVGLSLQPVSGPLHGSSLTLREDEEGRKVFADAGLFTCSSTEGTIYAVLTIWRSDGVKPVCYSRTIPITYTGPPSGYNEGDCGCISDQSACGCLEESLISSGTAASLTCSLGKRPGAVPTYDIE